MSAQQATQESALAQRAMLVRMTIKQWTGRRLDRKVTREVNEARGAAPDAGNYHKALLAKTALERIRHLATEIRLFHYANTLPWTDDGARLLPATHFDKYSEELRAREASWEVAVQEFIGNYPDYIADAEHRLNGMFDRSQYPSVGQIRRRFAMHVAIDPVPTSTDWRIDLGDRETARIRRQIEERLQEAIQHAQADLWQRLYDVVSHMAQRLSEPDAIFRDSLVGNACEICRLLTTLNVTQDAELERMRAAVESRLAERQPQELRTNPTERQDAARDAREIMQQMAGFMSQAGKETS